MVDVLVRPGVPKPWLAHEKEESVLRPGFISAGSSHAGRNLKRTFPFGDCLPRATGSWKSSLDPSMPTKFRRLHPQRIPEESTHCSTRDSLSNMSQTPSMGHHHTAVSSSHCYPPERAELLATTAMPSYPELMTAPSMKTTESSSGSSISEAEYTHLGPTNDPLLSSSVDTTVGLAHSMASTDAMWAMKTPSFGASTDDTPSISSSFDFTELPKQEQPAYHCFPLFDQHPNSQAIDSPFYLDSHIGKLTRMPISEATDGMAWCEWPVSGPPDSWSHAIAADEQIWPSAGYQTFNWPAQEALLNTPVDTFPLQTIPSSSIDHNSQYKNTSIPTTSSPETTHTAPIPKYPDLNNPHPHPPYLQAHPQPHTQYQPYTPSTTTPPTSNPSSTPLLPSKLPNNSYQHDHQPQTQAPKPTLHPEPTAETIKASLHYTDTRDAFLIECKRRGLSYKDIKRIGGFKEAESTLRGRFRTLTKAKEQRVRKPKWQERDVSLPSSSRPHHPPFLTSVWTPRVCVS